jgi:hypothetical protein
MGNCFRTPEDHTSLLPIPSTNHPSMTVSSSGLHSTSTTSDTSIPKVQLVTVNRSIGNPSIPTDINLIKAAQCRNLFERLPLINYNEKKIKQTE